MDRVSSSSGGATRLLAVTIDERANAIHSRESGISNILLQTLNRLED